MAEAIPINLNDPTQNKKFTEEMGGSENYALTLGTVYDPVSKRLLPAAGAEGSYAVPWIKANSFEELPLELRKSLVGGEGIPRGGYNPFANAKGYAVDPVTGQVMIKTPGGGAQFPSTYATLDENGNIQNFNKPRSSSSASNVSTSNVSTSNLSTSNLSTSTSTPPTGYTGSGTTGDPLKYNGVPFTGAYLGMNFVSGISNVSAAAKAERQSAYDALLAEFNKYGLGSLVKTVQGLIEKDVPPSQFIIELRNSPEYQQRFAANPERLKKGLAALSEAEYIRNEDNYRQILRTYGLTQFDNDAYVNQFLVNDVSPQELGERVVTAVNQIQMADPAITSTLKRFYGLTNSDMIGVILDPKTQLPQIQRTIAAAGIGTAAGRQGLNIGRDVAEQLAAQGVSQQEAERGYATIAEILPTAEKLSDIYGEELGRYGLPEAEQEVFNQLASAQRRRQRLVERERAAFSGQSGVGRTSLTEDNRAQF